MTAPELIEDLRAGFAFLTRLPMPHPDGARGLNFARAHRVFPVVGAFIGGAVGLCYLILLAINIPINAAAALSIGFGALLTGGLHEDGLADLADGFGGGRDKAAKLEIMRDSRLGTFGALVLLVAFIVKLSALAELPRDTVIPGLIAAHTLGRLPMTFLIMILPNTRSGGLAASAGRPSVATAAAAALLTFLIAYFSLPWTLALGAALAAAFCAAGVGALARWQIGGHTGDVLGAAEQVAEISVLVFLAAQYG